MNINFNENVNSLGKDKSKFFEISKSKKFAV